MLAFAPWLVRLTAIPPNILAPIVIGIVTLAAFQATSAIEDLVLTLAFAGLGIFMKWYGWPRPPILIAVALADILERYLWISINTYGYAMFLRPASLVILSVLVLTLVYTLRIRSRTASAMISISDAASQKEELALTSGGIAAESEQVIYAKATAARKKPGSISWDSLRRYWLSIAVLGEILLLLLSGGLFLYLLIDSFTWADDAGKLMPTIAVAIGAPFWLVRLAAILRRTSSISTGIMDVGFRIGTDPKAEIERFARVSLFVVGLYLAIWLFGFHVALPVGTFLYVFFYGKAGWLLSSVTGLAFLALIVGLYDLVMHTPWHDPLLAILFGLK